MYTIINNLSKDNHKGQLVKLSQDATEIILISPFIFDDFGEFIKHLSLDNVINIQLITTLNPKGDDHLRKPKALFSFIKNIREVNPKIECQIHIDNNLHGKVYLFKKSNEYLGGIITSANLTYSGLYKNHEWGILLKEQKLLCQLEQEILGSIDYSNIPHELIGEMGWYVDAYAKANGTINLTEHDIDAGLLNLLRKNVPSKKIEMPISFQKTKSCFLKPMGDSANPVLLEKQEKFGQRTMLRFPNPQPKKINSGDIFISFGTGSRSVLCIHTGLASAKEIPTDIKKTLIDPERWPRFINGYNHTPKFADEWWLHHITIDALRDEYLTLYPQMPIGATGAQSYGAFNFGAGYLEIDKDFAKFICDKILSIEENIKNS